MTTAEKECLLQVGRRLQGEAIRQEHETAEAWINGRWFDHQKHGQAAIARSAEAAACFAAIKL